MKTMRSTDELQEIYAAVYANSSLPEIDISGKVMNRIATKEGSIRKRAYRRKAAVVLAVSFVLLFAGFTTIWAAATGQTPGELAAILLARYKESIKEYYNAFKTTKTDTAFTVPGKFSMSEVLEYIEPGQGIAIQVPNEKASQIIIKPVPYSSMEELKENADLDFKVPFALPSGYSFRSGSIIYRLPYETLAKNTTDDVSIAVIDKTDSVLSIMIEYYNSDTGQSIWCHISRTLGNSSHAFKLKDAEKLDIDDMESYFTTTRIGEEEYNKQILVFEKLDEPVNVPNYFIPTVDTIAYTIFSDSQDVTKEMLLETAKSLR